MPSNFFDRLEDQSRIYAQKVLLGAEIGVLVVSAFIRFVIEPSSVVDFVPSIGGALLGACITAGIIEFQEERQSVQQ